MKMLILVISLFAMSFAANAVVLKDKKFVAPFGNEMQVVKAAYDFAKDGGAVASYEVAECTSALGCVLDFVSIEGITTVATTSGTLDLGYTGAGTAFLAATASGTLEAGDFTIPAETFVPVKIANGAKVLIEIKSAAFTAGKLAITMVFRKFGL
jgi:hypothetical protein